MPEIRITGQSAYPGDPPSSYTLVTGKQNNLLTKGIAAIGRLFMNLQPDQGGKAQTSSDTGLLIKTSPTIWEYEMFRTEWDRRTISRELDLMVRSDTRLKRANRIFAATAVRKGMTVTVDSSVSKKTAKKAQEIVNQIMRDAQINAKLASWARIILKEGDLFLNPVIDINTKQIKTIKRLPGISMQRNEGMDGNFLDNEKAFRQIDPISLIIIQDFPLWTINHIRWDHEEGDRYGNSQYLQCRGYWRKLNMTEEDLVIRRRTRAVPRRLHILGNKDHPGTKADIDNYRATNGLNAGKSQIATDYYMNGLGDIKDLNPDTRLNEIEDVKYLQEIYVLGMGVPLPIIGGTGKDVNRDVLEPQIKQFKEDAQELRDLIEYGDSSPYSGLRAIFDFGLALQGIDPSIIEYNIRWAEEDNETATERLDRVVTARSAQPKPLMTQETAVSILAKDNGLENQNAIKAEIEGIETELEQDRLDQATLQTEINPANPATSSLSRSTVTKEVAMDSIESDKKKDFFPLHGAKAAKQEKQFAKVLKKHFAKVNVNLKKHTLRHAEKAAVFQNVMDDGTPLIDEYIADYQLEWDILAPELQKSYFDFYKQIANTAIKRVKSENKIVMTDDVDDQDEEFINPETLQYLQEESLFRSKLIDDTNKKLLRKELGESYKNGENTAQWQARIDKVMGLNTPNGRSEMIARTELSWGYSRGLISGYKEVGIDRVQWLAVMDDSTCPVCAGNNGKTFRLSEVEGRLPAHPRCRCTIVGE